MDRIDKLARSSGQGARGSWQSEDFTRALEIDKPASSSGQGAAGRVKVSLEHYFKVRRRQRRLKRIRHRDKATNRRCFLFFKVKSKVSTSKH